MRASGWEVTAANPENPGGDSGATYENEWSAHPLLFANSVISDNIPYECNSDAIEEHLASGACWLPFDGRDSQYRLENLFPDSHQEKGIRSNTFSCCR